MGLESGEAAQPDFATALLTERVYAAVLRSAGSEWWETTGVKSEKRPD